MGVLAYRSHDLDFPRVPIASRVVIPIPPCLEA
jgi:hypothetical protein